MTGWPPRRFGPDRGTTERATRGVVAQGGSAALIGLALCGFVVIASLVTADLGALAATRARAQTAADLAALAAVTPYPEMASPVLSGSPVNRAEAIARANGAQVIGCACAPLEATVGVRLRLPLAPFGAAVEVRAYRAGRAGRRSCAPARRPGLPCRDGPDGFPCA